MSEATDNQELPEILQPEIVGVEEETEPIIDLGEEAGNTEEGVEEIDEVDEIDEVTEAETALKPPATKRSPTAKRSSTTKRPRTTRASTTSARDRESDRTPTQRAGARRLPRGKDQRAKLVVISATAGLLLLLQLPADRFRDS